MPPFAIALPVLSLADTTESGEGTIDPLGLELVAEGLARTLIPGVRERMSHARYLTLIAIAASVCDGFARDEVAADRVSEPWQVFEWFVVEGLVRAEAEGFILPGRLKAKNAIRHGAGLSRDRYLKIPAVYGFHGVYRVLARDLGILGEDDELTAIGDELVDAWARDRGLTGWRIGSGPGADLRRAWRDAVKDGLGAGRTVPRSKAWWSAIAEHLHPVEMRRHERAKIATLLDAGVGDRSEVLRFIATERGQRALDAATDKLGIDERAVHAVLRPSASIPLAALLDAIAAYERCARLLSDAFAEILFRASSAAGPVATADLASGPCVVRASRDLARAVGDASRLLTAAQQANTFDLRFAAFAVPMSPAETVSAVIDHHVHVQRSKPPGGKRPWLEAYGRGRVAVRAAYQREEAPTPSDRYVQFYRTATLRQFVDDLHLVER